MPSIAEVKINGDSIGENENRSLDSRGSDKDHGLAVAKEHRMDETSNFAPKDDPLPIVTSNVNPDITQSPSPDLMVETHVDEESLDLTPKVPPNSLEWDQLVDGVLGMAPEASTNSSIEYMLDKAIDARLERTYEFSAVNRGTFDENEVDKVFPQKPFGVPKNRPINESQSVRSSEELVAHSETPNVLAADGTYHLSSDGTYFIHPDATCQKLLDGSYYLPPEKRNYLPPKDTYQVLLDGTYYMPSIPPKDGTVLERPAVPKPTFGYVRKYKREEPIGDELRALSYLQSRHIFELFTFMISHLLAKCPVEDSRSSTVVWFTSSMLDEILAKRRNYEFMDCRMNGCTPDNEPLVFLDEVLDQCIAFRDQNGKPPLLFEKPHIEAVYGALDPLGQGDINYLQYQTGMKTMGLKKFSMTPRTTKRGTVEKQFFLDEAKATQTKELLQLLQIRGWEFTEDGEGDGTVIVGQQDPTVTLWPKEAKGGDAAVFSTETFSFGSDLHGSGKCYKKLEGSGQLSDDDLMMFKDKYMC